MWNFAYTVPSWRVSHCTWFLLVGGRRLNCLRLGFCYGVVLHFAYPWSSQSSLFAPLINFPTLQIEWLPLPRISHPQQPPPSPMHHAPCALGSLAASQLVLPIRVPIPFRFILKRPSHPQHLSCLAALFSVFFPPLRLNYQRRQLIKMCTKQRKAAKSASIRQFPSVYHNPSPLPHFAHRHFPLLLAIFSI